jgi:hypothetical protein
MLRDGRLQDRQRLVLRLVGRPHGDADDEVASRSVMTWRL